MKTYLIKLRPIDKFFFGTGKEFGIENENYFVKSRYLPQQTTLLGMLRYELLKLADEEIFKDNRIINKEKAKELIGAKSFVANEENNFGKINSISPLFLMKKDEKLFPQSKEFQENKNRYHFLKINYENGLPLLLGYEAKKSLPQIWQDQQGNQYNYDQIFTEQQQTGIRKPNYEEGETENENAFYVQGFYKMKTDFYFAFYVNVSDDIELKHSQVILGGERQLFQMQVFKEEQTQQFNFIPSSLNKAILTSDAYITEDLETICDFAITETSNFRCLQANVETEKYYAIQQKKQKKEDYKKNNLHKSKELQLYTMGSVFYFQSEEKKQAFEKAIKNDSFQKIGYNNFQLIDKN